MSNNNSNKNVLKIFYENGQELVSVNGVTGVLANKSEIESFRGPIPLSEYPINDDPNPIVVPKKCATPHHATQEITIRYLEPPPLPPPGDIIIQQELTSVVAPPAPPIIIRTKPEVKQPPQPLVIREAPPHRQIPIDRKIIKLPGSKVAPPPRKLIIEKPPPISDKAQPIVIERWLAPKVQPRRVIVDGPIFTGHPPIRNEIRVCEAPNVIINKEFINLGVTRADPNEYVSKYGNTLVEWNKLPEVARDIKPPTGVVLASEARSNLPPLEGDVHVLKYVDLEREGLSEYASYIHSFRSSKESSATNVTNTNTVANNIINSTSLNTSSYTAQERNESYSDRRNESSNERVVSTTTAGLPRPPSGGVIRTIVRNSYQVPLTSANNTYTAANVTNPNNSSTVRISNPSNNSSSAHVHQQGNGHTTTTYNIKYTHERRYVKDNNF